MYKYLIFFTDDIIIFTNDEVFDLRTSISFQDGYENCSGQRVNHSKISFSQGCIDQISNLTGFRNQDPHFAYLGCPIYVGRKWAAYFKPLKDKISARMNGWQQNLLDMGAILF